MFHINDQESAQRQGAWHRARTYFAGWPDHGCLHGLFTIGSRALKSLQRHMPTPTLGGSIAKHIRFRRAIPAHPGGQQGDFAAVRGENARTARREAYSRKDYDQLAILGLLNPASPLLDDRYGLEGLCPEEALGAMALDGPRTASTCWLTQLSPREGLVAIGLIHDSDIR